VKTNIIPFKIKEMMKEYNGDKRKKAYKIWKANEEKSKINLGDKVAKVTKATGIDKVVKFVFGEDCGCEERQEALNTEINKLFGRRHTEPLTQEEYLYILEVIDKRGVSHDDQIKMIRIYERVFEKKFTTSCTSCSFMANIYNPLEKLVNAYNEN